MKLPTFLLAALLPAGLAFAQATTDGDCALARDPARCEARQLALKTCADKRGAAKQECLDANMPPMDCSKASDPARCEAIEKAKEICRDKVGKEQKACLKGQTPKKAKKAVKPKPKKKKAKAAKRR